MKVFVTEYDSIVLLGNGRETATIAATGTSLVPGARVPLRALVAMLT